MQALGVAFVLLLAVGKFGVVPVAIALVLGWLAWSYRRPMTRCWLCKGSPRNFDSSGKNWSNCLACGGSGRRRRLGAVLLGRGFGKM
jgi:hypothetical protein